MADALIGMYEGIANGLFVREDKNLQWRGKTSIEMAVKRIANRYYESGQGREEPKHLQASL